MRIGWLGVLWLAVELVGLVGVIAVAAWGYFKWDRRYHGAAGSDGFAATPETFLDPTTGRRMTVFFNASTGQRQYRESA